MKAPTEKARGNCMARLDESARGVYPIAVTPFTDDGALDLESTDRMVDFYLERGATGLALLGIMGQAPKLTAIRAASERGEVRRISILTGNGGGLFLPEELARGDIERAHDLFDAYLPLARYEQQPNIGLAVRKYLMVKRGAIASAAIRKPGPRLSAADVADIERLVRRQDRRLAELA